MPTPFDFIPDEVKKEAANAASSDGKQKPQSPREKGGTAAGGTPPQGEAPRGEKEKEPKTIGEEKKQHRLFKYRRAGVVLSEDEVKAIKAGRKKLRKEMRARGIRSRREFELTAGALGLYFDKSKWGLLLWLGRHWLGALLGALAAFLAVLFLFSAVQYMRGHFTISLSDGMFREGFTLSDSVGFEHPTVQLFATPAADVPCISINQIPTNVDSIDGEHNGQYFAYTYYIRNEGESTVDYTWSLSIASETQSLSSGVWAMLFEDGVLRIYARANSQSGEAEALPPLSDNSRGYLSLPVRELAPQSDQFSLVRTVGDVPYYRVIPDSFLSDREIAAGRMNGVAPMQAHKYTVVLWLEGDDADVTDAMIGGHLGAEMNFRLESEAERSQSTWTRFWDGVFSSVRT